MNEVVKALPQIIYYIVLGFIYLRVFRFVCIVQNTQNKEHMIWESLMSGYIINVFWAFVSLNKMSSLEQFWTMAIEIVGTIIIAFVLGKLWSWKFIDFLASKFKILHSREQFVWQEMIDTNSSTWVDIRNNITRERYYGKIHRCEGFNNKPVVVLRDFTYWRDYDDNNCVEKHDGDNNTAVMLDTSKFDEIIFRYSDGNTVIPKIKQEKTSRRTR